MSRPWIFSRSPEFQKLSIAWHRLYTARAVVGPDAARESSWDCATPSGPVTMVFCVGNVQAKAEWEAVLARSAQCSVEQEPIEVLDLCARAAQRAGRADDAARAWARARELDLRIPNVFDPRLSRA